jgi:hypothetical protein
MHSPPRAEAALEGQTQAQDDRSKRCPTAINFDFSKAGALLPDWLDGTPSTQAGSVSVE